MEAAGRRPGLAAWTRAALGLFMVVAAGCLVSDLMQIVLLMDMFDGVYATRTALHAAAEANDRRQLAAAGLRLGAYAGSGALVLAWTWRANVAVRRLGARGLRFSPGWAVGWYFVPLANLLLPWRALQEIWRASAQPRDWQAQPAPGWLGWWWFYLLVAGAAGAAAVLLPMGEVEMLELFAASAAMLLSDAAGLVSAAILFVIVGRVQRMQDGWAGVAVRGGPVL